MNPPTIVFYEHSFDDSLIQSLSKNVLNLGNECRALSEENARLKADVERLKSLCDNLGMGGKHTITAIMEENARLKAEVERLRASSFVTAVPVEQYERLIKAGDAMADEIIGCYNAEGYDPADSETLLKWNAAKEGKPIV